jgi:hypothetical protein
MEQIEENEIGDACSMVGRTGICTELRKEKSKENVHWENINVDSRRTSVLNSMVSKDA